MYLLLLSLKLKTWYPSVHAHKHHTECWLTPGLVSYQCHSCHVLNRTNEYVEIGDCLFLLTVMVWDTFPETISRESYYSIKVGFWCIASENFQNVSKIFWCFNSSVAWTPRFKVFTPCQRMTLLKEFNPITLVPLSHGQLLSGSTKHKPQHRKYVYEFIQ